MFVCACFALVKGSLLITASVNISCGTKEGRLVHKQLEEKGASWEGETSKQGFYRRWFGTVYSGGLQSRFQCKLEMKLGLFADYLG